MYLYSFFNLGTRWGGGRSTSHPGCFTPGKEICYILHRRLSGPQGQSGQVQKILPLLEFNPWTIQPTASHYRRKYWISIPNKMLKWRQTCAYDDLCCFHVALLTDKQTISYHFDYIRRPSGSKTCLVKISVTALIIPAVLNLQVLKPHQM